MPSPESDEAVPELDARIAGLKSELDDLLRKYTDQHPDVVSNKRLMAQLEDERKTELEERRKAEAANGKPPRTLFQQQSHGQQLRMSLAEAEANVASMRGKLAAYQNQYRLLLAQAQLVPQVEAEFTQLNRDYDVQKRTYESLLSRREAGALGIDVQDAGAAQFRVIDPPRVTQEPVAPNRLALVALALAGSIGAGLRCCAVGKSGVPDLPQRGDAARRDEATHPGHGLHASKRGPHPRQATKHLSFRRRHWKPDRCIRRCFCLRTAYRPHRLRNCT